MNTRIKSFRKWAGMTQVELALKARITERSYQRIESGLQDPRTSTSLLLAKALETTVEELFPLEDTII